MVDHIRGHLSGSSVGKPLEPCGLPPINAGLPAATYVIGYIMPSG